MVRPVYMTTSWDDGHPLDLRVADLLAKHGIAGTFYIPMSNERDTLSPGQLRDLATTFEIGAHTLHHVDLTAVTEDVAWQEIRGSRSWVEDSAGAPCACFCPPLGRYTSRHVPLIRKAGFIGLRSTEFLSLDFPRPQGGLLLMPTTLQAFPHGPSSFARNAIKRMALANLWRYVVHGCPAEWPVLAEAMLRRAATFGGVFHLWGHSWELQDFGQWQRLEHVLRLMGELAGRTMSVTNGQLCRLHMPSVGAPEHAADVADIAGARG